MASKNIQDIIKLAVTKGVLTLNPPKTEFLGPLIIDKPIVIDGQGATLRADSGPVLTIYSKNVTINNLRIAVMSNEKDGLNSCALKVEPKLKNIVFNNIEIEWGTVVGLNEEEGIWEYPKQLDLKKIMANHEHEFSLEFSLPVPCDIKVVDLEDVEITPLKIAAAGTTKLNLKISHVAPNVLLRGFLVISTQHTIRKIRLIARATNDGIVGSGQLIWSPGNTNSLNISSVKKILDSFRIRWPVENENQVVDIIQSQVGALLQANITRVVEAERQWVEIALSQLKAHLQIICPIINETVTLKNEFEVKIANPFKQSQLIKADAEKNWRTMAAEQLIQQLRIHFPLIDEKINALDIQANIISPIIAGILKLQDAENIWCDLAISQHLNYLKSVYDVQNATAKTTIENEIKKGKYDKKKIEIVWRQFVIIELVTLFKVEMPLFEDTHQNIELTKSIKERFINGEISAADVKVEWKKLAQMPVFRPTEYTKSIPTSACWNTATDDVSAPEKKDTSLKSPSVLTANVIESGFWSLPPNTNIADIKVPGNKKNSDAISNEAKGGQNIFSQNTEQKLLSNETNNVSAINKKNDSQKKFEPTGDFWKIQ